MNTNIYICCNISGAAADSIQNIRNKYDQFTCKLPVEITVIGSSGIGPISKDEPDNKIKNEFRAAMSGMNAFNFIFQEIDYFPNTPIFYLKPNNREYFDELHNNFKKMNLKFMNNKFPYNPHCTLSCNPNLSKEQQRSLQNEIIYSKNIEIESISLYEFSGEPFICNKVETLYLNKTI
jgi:2'-5' RNA ligase